MCAHTQHSSGRVVMKNQGKLPEHRGLHHPTRSGDRSVQSQWGGVRLTKRPLKSHGRLSFFVDN